MESSIQWNGKDKSIKVTVYCTTYNHAKYISKALEGFVAQQTSFPFEIIVHDDASTDGTAEIVREYAKKNPMIIPVLQSENQYSKGNAIFVNFVLPIARGEYIAYCEGDDYWTDSNKLQIQYDYMREHHDCSLCCHAYNAITKEGDKILSVQKMTDTDGDIAANEIIIYRNPPQLATFMLRKSLYINRPAFFNDVGIGDYPLLCLAVTRGNIHYMNRVMSNYRVAADGSWTIRISMNLEKKIEHLNRLIQFLTNYNEWTKKEYDFCIKERIDELEYCIAWFSGLYRKAITYSAYRRMPFRRKLLNRMGCIFPRLVYAVDKKWYRYKCNNI